MVYRAIGLMSGSSLDGLDIAFVSFHENAGQWSYDILQAECYPYTAEWQQKLRTAVDLPARDYLLLHTAFGAYIGQAVNQFIEKHRLHYQVSLVASHGHTSFHIPSRKMTGQLGDGAAIAAVTELPVVTDLRALDVAFGGQGAPIVPIGEKLLLGAYDYFLNLGGIANISFNDPHHYIAFDVCPANRVLNMLVSELGKEYDAGGMIAATGKVDLPLLEKLNALDYYKQPFPKSLANDFGTEVVYPLLKEASLTVPDALRTCTEHVAFQISRVVPAAKEARLLATGGGAFNTFLVERIRDLLKEKKVDIIVPEALLVNFKEALIMAFIGVLRWRQEYNVLSSVTGASRGSIGGALWTGQEA